MAFTVQNKVFGGKYTQKIVGDLIANNTLQAALGIPVIETIKDKYVWSDLTQNIVVNAFNTKPINPSDNSTQTYNENVGVMCNYELSNDIRKDILVGTYREQFLQTGTQVEDPRQDGVLFNIILDQLRGKVQEKISELLLQQDPAYAFDACEEGLMLQFRDNTRFRPVPAGQLIEGTSAISVKSTVAAQLDLIIAAMPAEVKHRLDGSGRKALKFAVHTGIFDALESLLADNEFINTAVRYGVDEDTNIPYLTYRGYRVYAVHGLLANEAVLANWGDNVAILVDANEDASQLVITDDYITQRKATVSWRMDFRLGIMFGNGDEIVSYSPAN